jgi:hypothetical protein
MSLKDELLGAPRAAPPYQLLLPPDWAAFEPDEQTQSLLLGEAKARFREAHRPDLAAQMMRMATQAFSQMRRNDTIAFYMHRPGQSDDVLPISITVSHRVAPDGQNFDRTVSELIRSQGAQPFDAAKVMIRWAKETVHEVDGERIATHTIAYLTPIPGSMRREALQFAAVVSHPVGMDAESGILRSYILACDAIMATFAWLPE